MIQQKIERHIESLTAGTVISVSHGLYRHVALIAEESFYGERKVLAFSAEHRGFVEQTFADFSQGREVVINGYFGRLPSSIVLQRARLMKGKHYSWVNFNCEHFVRCAHGVSIESPQLQSLAMVSGATVALLAFAARL
jgi:hypothetical protein